MNAVKLCIHQGTLARQAENHVFNWWIRAYTACINNILIVLNTKFQVIHAVVVEESQSYVELKTYPKMAMSCQRRVHAIKITNVKCN